ncbi:MAG: NADH-quinone oxidoreductase subunit H [Planctomycetes bacterium]|nr:NADH-quinone oxidoreductase subunit H [Planctomycetota bacterium]
MPLPSLAMLAAALLLCPLLSGIINRVKAVAAGRQGKPLLQLYRDLAKLAKKDVVYPTASTWIFRACPALVAGAAVAAALVTPLGGGAAALSFQGDFAVWVGAFALARMFMVLAALDVGSSFEGMGASREIWFAALAEGALYLVLAALTVISGGYSLSDFYTALTPSHSTDHVIALIFAGLALFLLALVENARIPIDDPTTHLELTMIHEVMILDHGGPDLAMIQYGSALKLWVMGGLVVGLAVPVRIGSAWLDAGCFLIGMAVFAALIGIVESAMARLRFARAPQFIIGAGVLAGLSIVLCLRSM